MKEGIPIKINKLARVWKLRFENKTKKLNGLFIQTKVLNIIADVLISRFCFSIPEGFRFKVLVYPSFLMR